MTKLRILLAEDHAALRHRLRVLLESQPNYQLCGEAANGREAVEKVRQLKPDVVVMDISMPELNGLDATRLILQDAPQTAVLILTVHNSAAALHEAMRVGACGYVLKSDADTDLVRAITSVRQHRQFFTSRSTR